MTSGSLAADAQLVRQPQGSHLTTNQLSAIAIIACVTVTRTPSSLAGPCESVKAPMIAHRTIPMVVSVGGDLMPIGFSLSGGILIDPSIGQRLPSSLRADSAWFTGKGRTVAVALAPQGRSEWSADSISAGRRVFAFRVFWDSLGPGAMEWLHSLDEQPRYRGAIRVRLVWQKDTAYVDASECPMEFSM